MKYTIRYLPEALEEMLPILAYLAEYSTTAPGKFASEVETQIKQLEDFPRMYPAYEHNRDFRVIQTLFDYQVFYIVNEKARSVDIHHILHGRRNIKKFLETVEKNPE